MEGSRERPPTILIVEDTDWIRAAMRRSVERTGCRAVEAADAYEAAAVAERETVELILTEEELPTLDALLSLAREHAALRGAPVVIVNPDAEEGARLGDAHVLTDYERITSLLPSPCE
jgi:DNA-binding response OmpR family regulator